MSLSSEDEKVEWRKLLANITSKADGFLRYYFPVVK